MRGCSINIDGLPANFINYFDKTKLLIPLISGGRYVFVSKRNGIEHTKHEPAAAIRSNILALETRRFALSYKMPNLKYITTIN